jgi:isopropylmalate/homocitrate/citramalate synthase
MEDAIESGCTEVAVYVAASETFSRRTTNCSVLEGLERARTILSMARPLKIAARGYVACAIQCPFEGPVEPDTVVRLASALLEAGCCQVALSDNTGTGTPATTSHLLQACARSIPIALLAGHFHDTYGTAISNVCEALCHGMTTFGASTAGLGGCEYAPGSSGNVATEDLVYLLHGMGHRTGLSTNALRTAADFICKSLGRRTNSRVGRALEAANLAQR